MRWFSFGLAATVVQAAFDPTQHLGGNSPWFEGPNIFGIENSVPEECTVDTAAFVSRHGSRYPDPGAYQGWVTLSEKIAGANFSTTGPLTFLQSWQPTLTDPEQQLSQLSIGGWRELYTMGTNYRYKYRHLYEDNTPFEVFANRYSQAPRVVDSARLFARGFMGPNSTLGQVYVIDSKDPRAVADSLGPSDICPTYKDNGSGERGTAWDNLYLPPIKRRVNSMIKGGLVFTDSEVSQFPYLCGFETQITGKTSPWCSIFTEAEFEQYEYAQDLRYYYGTGPGSGKNSTMMLPVLNAIVQRLQDGPGKSYVNSKQESWTPHALIAMFANDGQINQLAAEIGVFDNQEELPSSRIPRDRLFVASRYSSMRGTIAFERLTCSSRNYVRIALNDAVYPVATCQSGPGRSCPLDEYAALIREKTGSAGSFNDVCNLTSNSTAARESRASFLVDNALPWEFVVSP